MDEAARDEDVLAGDSDIDSIVDQLCTRERTITRRAVGGGEPLPSRVEVIRMVDGLRAALFPGYFGVAEVTPETLRYHIGHALDGVHRTLEVQIRRCLAFSDDSVHHGPELERRSAELASAFLARLPAVQHLLAGDVQAAYEGDPAALSPNETVFCYPGVLAIASYRLAHELYKLEVPLLPRMISEHAHSVTGIDIHPGATIGERFFIDHGTGVVIGETGIVGDRVRIYQGVTLGAKSFPLDQDGKPIKGIARHPIIEDDVVIYSGATILGRVTIGHGSIIGGNVWLTKSVPPLSRITIQPLRYELFDHGAGI